MQTDRSNENIISDVPPAVVEIRRGGLVESVHRAHACVVGSDGRLWLTIGDSNHVAYLRSSAKPLQAAAMIRMGLTAAYALERHEIAIICGSHGGESIHVETVQALLAKAGLDVKALQCGVQSPLDASVRRDLQGDGFEPTPLHHNCSGKHAGMLLTARLLNLDLAEYLDPASQVQQGITAFIGEVSAYNPGSIVIGRDGCSAPVHALPMRNAALAFARLVEPTGLTDAAASAMQTAARAMRAHPEMVAASRDRICTELIRAGGEFDLTAKGGAEGYYAVAWRDRESGLGMGLTVKVEDGAQRARDPLVLTLLQEFGVLPEPLPATLQQFSAKSIENFAGKVTGEVVAKLDAIKKG